MTVSISAPGLGQEGTPPVTTKTFAPSRIAPGESSTLSFTISNPNQFTLTGVGFSDNLPSGLTISTPNGLSGSCGSGTITAVAGSNSISLSGASIPAGGSCTFSVSVTASSEGAKANTTSAVSSNVANGAPASAILLVARRPVIGKSFAAASIGPGDIVALTFTLNNPNSVTPLTGVAFSDALPGGLVVASPNGLAGSCGGGTITAVAGSGSIALSGATLAPGAGCTFSVNVTATGTPQGLLVNSTGTVTSNEAPPGAAATASIFVGNPFQISYFPNLNLADSVINITNAGSSSPPPPVEEEVRPAAEDRPIIVDVYVFSPDEQMVSCCACPVTPNGLVSLSVLNDLVSNTLTPAHPSSVVVKLVSTVSNGGVPNAGALNLSPLASGMAAWGTKIHNANGAAPGGGLSLTEAPFSNAILSPGELTRLSTLCSLIQANGSGFGVCRSCRLGGLGAGGR